MDAPAVINEYIRFYKNWINTLPEGEENRKNTRDMAMDFVNSKGFPTVQDEAWRFTNISPVTGRVFQPRQKIESDFRLKEKINEALFKNWGGAQIVLIDGLISEQLSDWGKTGEAGVLISSTSKLDETRQSNLTTQLRNSPAANDNAFTALNTAFHRDGVWLEIPDRLKEDVRVHILYYSTGSSHNSAAYPRLFVKVGQNSELQLTESYLGETGANYFTNAVGEIDLADDARMWHYRIQEESLDSYHLSHTYVRQQKHSDYQTRQIAGGAAISRNQVNIVLNGEYCETGLDGLYLGHGGQLVDNQTFIDHARPNCHSRELFRGILTDKARGVFSGIIMVRPDAQKTDAEQNNNALLLSDDAKIDAKPQLEIYADDVKCTHGATVGQLDEEAMFYLQSRGIGFQTARNMLIYAFAEEVIEMIRDGKVKDRIEKIILKRLNEDMQFVKNGEE